MYLKETVTIDRGLLYDLLHSRSNWLPLHWTEDQVDDQVFTWLSDLETHSNQFLHIGGTSTRTRDVKQPNQKTWKQWITKMYREKFYTNVCTQWIRVCVCLCVCVRGEEGTRHFPNMKNEKRWMGSRSDGNKPPLNRTIEIKQISIVHSTETRSITLRHSFFIWRFSTSILDYTISFIILE